MIEQELDLRMGQRRKWSQKVMHRMVSPLWNGTYQAQSGEGKEKRRGNAEVGHRLSGAPRLNRDVTIDMLCGSLQVNRVHVYSVITFWWTAFNAAGAIATRF